jgi:hypothetical protein
MKSLLFSVPLEGNCSIRTFNEELIGCIGPDAGIYRFNVSSNFTFIPITYFIPDRSPTVSHP